MLLQWDAFTIDTQTKDKPQTRLSVRWQGCDEVTWSRFCIVKL